LNRRFVALILFLGSHRPFQSFFHWAGVFPLGASLGLFFVKMVFLAPLGAYCFPPTGPFVPFVVPLAGGLFRHRLTLTNCFFVSLEEWIGPLPSPPDSWPDLALDGPQPWRDEGTKIFHWS